MLGWLTPLVVCVVAYVFLGLAEVSEERPVQQPLAARGFFFELNIKTSDPGRARHTVAVQTR